MPEDHASHPKGGEAPSYKRYSQTWEALCKVSARLVHAGWTEDHAKEDICNALAEAPLDRKIDFRVMVQAESDESDGGPPGYRNVTMAPRAAGHWLKSQQVQIPPNLSPPDFDWERSRPIAPWLTTFSSFHDHRIGAEPEQREIDLIELRTADVVRLFMPSSLTDTIAQIPQPQQEKPGRFNEKTSDEFLQNLVKENGGRLPTKKMAYAKAQEKKISGGRPFLDKSFAKLFPGQNRPPGRPSK